MGKIHQSIGSGGIESMVLLKKRSALITTKKWTVWLKLTPRNVGMTSNPPGQDTFGKREWYHQFLSDVITSPAELATQITLKCITQEPLMPAQTQPNVVPPDLLASLLEEVSSDLAKLSTHKAAGQDGIS